MRSALIATLLLVMSSMAWTMPEPFDERSPTESTDSMICFTESEWKAFGEESKVILQETVEEAVKGAVQPLQEKIYRQQQVLKYAPIAAVVLALLSFLAGLAVK